MVKLSKFCGLFCPLLILCCGNAVFAATPFDDFAGPRIDTDKWHGNSTGLEVVREVSNGKFISRLGGIGDGSNIIANRLSLSDPDKCSKLSAKITINEAQVDSDYASTTAAVVAQLEGYFYKDQDGDVWAGISLAYDGTNWTIFYEFWAQSSSLYKNDFSLTIEPGTEYLVSIQYDGNNNFTFKVNDESHTLQGPAYVDAADNPYKSLTTKIWPHNEGPGAGYISATFDDVTVNDTLYDDFSSTHIDPVKWWDEEIVREIRDGKLQMNVQNRGNEKTNNPIYLNDEYRTDFFQADLTLSSTTEITESDIAGFIKVYGSFFNAQHDGSSGNPYNWSEGEIFAGSGLNYNTNGPPRPAAYVYRCDDPYCTTGVYLFQQDFSCATQYDVPVTMSVEQHDNTLIFHCNKEKLSYQLSGTLYPSNWHLRKIRSSIESEKDVTSYLKATADNVYVKKQTMPWNLFLPAILSQHSKK